MPRDDKWPEDVAPELFEERVPDITNEAWDDLVAVLLDDAEKRIGQMMSNLAQEIASTRKWAKSALGRDLKQFEDQELVRMFREHMSESMEEKANNFLDGYESLLQKAIKGIGRE